MDNSLLTMVLSYFARYRKPAVLWPGEAHHMRPRGSLLSSRMPLPAAGTGYSTTLPVSGSMRSDHSHRARAIPDFLRLIETDGIERGLLARQRQCLDHARFRVETTHFFRDIFWEPVASILFGRHASSSAAGKLDHKKIVRKLRSNRATSRLRYFARYM